MLAVASEYKPRARVYIALNESLSGNRENALKKFRLLVSNPDEDVFIYTLSVLEIKRLEAAQKTK